VNVVRCLPITCCWFGRSPESTSIPKSHRTTATFFAQVEAAAGSGIPQFVKDEFEAFLEYWSAGTGDWTGVFNSYYWIDRDRSVGGVNLLYSDTYG
jgi:hypothetical protein